MEKIYNPLVSIIMATYNRANQLELTIKNIFEQSYKAVELVIINVGSSDDTLSILNHLQKTYDFIIINNTTNLGLQKSLNKGILIILGVICLGIINLNMNPTKLS
jgi:glycosyltransferase involved in cell wall biosynthesis